jgi:hypothetical protein
MARIRDQSPGHSPGLLIVKPWEYFLEHGITGLWNRSGAGLNSDDTRPGFGGPKPWIKASPSLQSPLSNASALRIARLALEPEAFLLLSNSFLRFARNLVE